MSRKKKEIKLISACEKCGKRQKPEREKSTMRFDYYDCHERCECGGKFVMKMEE